MPVHLGVQEGVRAGNHALGAADVGERVVRDERDQVLGVVVEGLHIGGFDGVLPGHLADDQLGIHHELDIIEPELQAFGDPGDEPAVFCIVVGVHAQELSVLVHDLPVDGYDDGIGGFPRVAAGPAVRIGAYLRHR